MTSAMRNTTLRVVGEVVGRLASLALFAAVGRSVGEDGLGAFVLALAVLQIGMWVVDLGLDRYILRRISSERELVHEYFANVFALKLVLSVPVFALCLGGLAALGYGAEVQHTAWALAAGVAFDSLARTLLAACSAHERAEPVAAGLIVQRLATAGIGIGVLALGAGVPAVAGAYSLGSALGLATGLWLMVRTIGRPRLQIARHSWRPLIAESLPYAVQDVLTILLA